MTADENDYCPCGCEVIWSTKHQMPLCLHCDIGNQPKNVLVASPCK